MKKTALALLIWISITGAAIGDNLYCWNINGHEYCGTLKQEIVSLLRLAKTEEEVIELIDALHNELNKENGND